MRTRIHFAALAWLSSSLLAVSAAAQPVPPAGEQPEEPAPGRAPEQPPAVVAPAPPPPQVTPVAPPPPPQVTPVAPPPGYGPAPGEPLPPPAGALGPAPQEAAPVPAAPVNPPPPAAAAPDKPTGPLPDHLKVEALWYLHYIQRSKGGEESNAFRIGRGYLTAKFKPTEYLGARMTLDTHQNDEGDWAVRLKYLYGQLFAPDIGQVLTGINVEYGLAHRPWLDYEEHINQYRMQGTMFLERVGLFNSADLGVTVGALLGPELDEDYTKNVSKYYPGQFGSFAVGVYNGGGYHAPENNENKTVEGRLSVRPLGPIFPNLQLSYFGVVGKGNTEEAPDWVTHAAMASFEHEYAVLTGTYLLGEGNQGGSLANGDDARKYRGASAFGELKLPWIHSSLFGRYDWFDLDRSGGDAASKRVLFGAAYFFHKHNALVADWDWLNEGESTKPDEKAFKLTLQIQI